MREVGGERLGWECKWVERFVCDAWFNTVEPASLIFFSRSCEGCSTELFSVGWRGVEDGRRGGRRW